VNNFDRNPSRVIFGGGNNAPPPAEATASTPPRGANASAPPRVPSGQKRQ
jgi:phospholipid/cholesterol/gamma-HCH transport system substrate-binding protein